LKGAGGGLKSPLVAAIIRRRLTGETGKEREIRFSAAAQGGGLGGLEAATGCFERFLRLARFHQQQQAAYLA
jgi:hypothetical protein